MLDYISDTNAELILVSAPEGFIFCRNCFYYDSEANYCWMLELNLCPDFFCSYGKSCD